MRAIAAPQLRAVGLICAVHFFSHFYLLILPALLPVLAGAYNVGYTELGFALSAYSIATGLLQAPIGFVVDRHGARHLLIAAMFIIAIAFMMIGIFTSYIMLVLLLVVAGGANAVFHPANYALLNASVPDGLIGRAFSWHSFSAQIGNAAGPMVALALLAVTDFSTTLLLCGAAGLVVAALLSTASGCLCEPARRDQPDTDAPRSGHASKPFMAGAGACGVSLLLSVPVLLGFAFFVLTSITHRGMTGFGVTTLHMLHEMVLSKAGLALAAYLLGAPVGVLIGGWLADRTQRHTLVAVCMFSLIACSAAALTSQAMTPSVAAFAFFIIGACQGIATPSRDMMIRAITPPGQTGKVFGFVSSGLNLGGALAPPVFGYLLDRGEPATVFLILCAVAGGTIIVALASNPHRLSA
jgi:MFS transporter, FSR family, fosmidomycin resistance protein